MHRSLARLSGRFPVLLAHSLAAARKRAADPEIRDLLARIEAAHRRAARRPASVYVATPRRFLARKRLANPNDAIRTMLEVIATVQDLCRDSTTGCRFVTTEALPKGAPGQVFFSHHTIQDEGLAQAAFQGASVWHFKSGDLPGTLTIDPGGFSGWSTLADLDYHAIGLPALPLAEVEAFFRGSREAIRSANLSKYRQPQAGAAATGDGPYVFVALQTEDDLVQRKAYLPMLTMLELAVRRFAGTPYRVVVKRHPSCRSERVARAIDAALRAAPGRVAVSTASIHDLLEGAAAVFTVNSGVGSEAMIYGIPIYCFGASDYAAVAHQVRSADDLARLTRPLRTRLTAEQQVRFYHYYRTIHQTRPGRELRDRIARIIAAARPHPAV